MKNDSSIIKRSKGRPELPKTQVKDKRISLFVNSNDIETLGGIEQVRQIAIKAIESQL